jgi:hypothetical protein
MARIARTIGFSVPPSVAEEVERLAAEEGRTKSELFREMVRVYRAHRGLVAGEEAAAYGAERTATLGPTVDELPEIFASLPHLTPEEADAFAADLEAIRAEVVESVDPWEL